MSKQIVTVGKRRKYNKDSLTWVAGKGWQGVVYIYRLDAPGDEKDGWVYVGCTPEEETRKNRWNKPKSKYAGKKIAAARKRYALVNFKYTVVDTLYDRDIDKLVEKLEDREKDFIKIFDSFEHGFNSNKGGSGRRGTKISIILTLQSKRLVQPVRNARKPKLRKIKSQLPTLVRSVQMK